MFDIAPLHRCSGRTVCFFPKYLIPWTGWAGKASRSSTLFFLQNTKKTATQITPTATQFNIWVAETDMQNFDSKFIPAVSHCSDPTTCCMHGAHAWICDLISKWVPKAACVPAWRALDPFRGLHNFSLGTGKALALDLRKNYPGPAPAISRPSFADQGTISRNQI